jgi:polysaccharide export outer membrane protein
MFRTGKYPVSQFSDSLVVKEYKLAPNDELTITISNNLGEEMIDPVNKMTASYRGIITYIESDSLAKLPVLGRINLTGMTVREAEDSLEKQYSAFNQKCFVRVSVTNKRVTVFSGSTGSAGKVIKLDNPNTTLLEAIAMAGGVNDGRAHKVKLIRGDLKNPQLYIIDLSTIEGMRKANLVLQANDIIYVEPRARIPEKIIATLAPYLTLLTTALLVYGLFK